MSPVGPCDLGLTCDARTYYLVVIRFGEACVCPYLGIYLGISRFVVLADKFGDVSRSQQEFRVSKHIPILRALQSAACLPARGESEQSPFLLFYRWIEFDLEFKLRIKLQKRGEKKKEREAIRQNAWTNVKLESV